MFHVIYFKKGSNVRYVSHLSLMRSFERALRRTDIPLAYSQGFNPRIKMSFALPMPVGMEGTAEVMYIETEHDYPPSDIVADLKKVLPEGIDVLGAKLSYKKAEYNPLIREADYDVFLDKIIDIDFFEEVFRQDKLIVKKKTKRKFKEIDIKPMIKNVSFSEKVISMRVPVGEVLNIRPDLVIKQLFKDYHVINMIRTNIYLEDGSKVWNI